MSPPYSAYAAITGSYASLLIAGAAASRRLERELPQTTLDFVVLSAATFKLARTLSRDKVGSFVREPFVEGEAHDGKERPVASGDLRQALGELVTCTRCLGAWSSASLVTAQIAAPRLGRLATWALAAAAVNDWLQAGFSAASKRA